MGKYQLIYKLATGGMAEVFLAKAAGPMGFEKTLVVKRILPHLAEDPQFIEMFLSEAKLAALLNHANVAQIFDFGDEDGSYFIAMEYIDGSNLRILSRRAFELKTPIAFPLCAKLVSFACEGLAYAHELLAPDTGEPLGLIHRDISPDNIMVSRSGGVKVVDFGIAKAANQINQTRGGILKGKLSYMSPEQLKAEPLDPRVDVYALGVVLYELVVGRKPFDAESEVGLMRAILEEPLRPAGTRRAELPPELDRIIDKALAKPRGERYASCRALQADLERFLIRHGEPVGAFQIAELVKALAPPAPDKGAQATPRRSNAAVPTPQKAAPSPPPMETKVEVPPTEVDLPSSVKGRSRMPVGAWVAAGVLLLVGVGGYLGWRQQDPAPSLAPRQASIASAAEALEPPAVAALLPAEPRQEAEPKAPAQERQDGPPQLASFVVESVPPGDIRINGESVGASPARVEGVKPGELRIEASGPDFAREERLLLKSGDNGVLRIVAEKGTMKIRGLPVETPVTLDGRLLGPFPAPQELYEGTHRIQVVDPQTGKTLEFDCPRLPPRESRICKFKLGSE